MGYKGERYIYEKRDKLASKEIEVKVLNLSSREELFNKIGSLGAVRVGAAERMLSDRRYEFLEDSEFQPVVVGNALALNETELENLIQAFEYCGYTVERQGNFLKLISFKKDPEKKLSLRLRKDGAEKTFFTVKSEIQKKEEFVERDEIEAELENSAETRKVFRELIESLGFKQKSHMQKQRTSFNLAYKGQKVKLEYNVSPIAEVRPWLEVEAENPEHISEIVQMLGYGQTDLFLGSDSEMYKTLYNLKAKKIKFNSI